MRRVLVVLMAALVLATMSVGLVSAAKPLPKLVLLSGDSQIARLYAQGVQEMIRKNLGLPIEIEAVDFKTRLQKMRNKDFQIVFAGWGADYDDPMTFLDMWVTDGPFNDVMWSNPSYDKLIDVAKTSSDEAVRMKAMSQAEKILIGEMPIAPLYWPAWNYVEHPYVKNVIRKTVGSDYEWKWAYTEGRPGGDKDQFLRLNFGEEPPDLDPATSTDQVSFWVINATYEGLARKNPEMKVLPGSGLAESWTVSKDRKVYTFKLRDAKWSDGVAVTAYDFEYGWKRAIDPRTASQYAYMMYVIKNAEKVNGMEVPDDKDPKKAEKNKAIDDALATVGVKALDAKTLRVELEAPTPFFLDLITFITYMPSPKHMVEKLGDEYASEVDKMVACGPFKISKWQHEYKIILEKNPNYWDAKSVKLQRIEADMIKDIATPLNMFDAGELDFVGVPGTYIDQYRNKGMKTIAEATSWYLEFNCKHEIFKNAKVRKAFSLAIDRQAYVDYVLKNGSLPATSLVPPTIHGKDGVSFHDVYVGDLLPTKADVKLAKQLLAEGLAELGYAMP